jgi:hypothetical protein
MRRLHLSSLQISPMLKNAKTAKTLVRVVPLMVKKPAQPKVLMPRKKKKNPLSLAGGEKLSPPQHHPLIGEPFEAWQPRETNQGKLFFFLFFIYLFIYLFIHFYFFSPTSPIFSAEDVRKKSKLNQSHFIARPFARNKKKKDTKEKDKPNEGEVKNN